jgi:arsenate reductase
MNQRIRVLFLCTGNSARSIMAESLLRTLAGDRFDAYSAGTAPKGVNPLTLRVLQQAGLRLAGLESKSLTGFLEQDFDYVITVCDNAAEHCPVFPGSPRRLHWSLADPASVQGSDAVRLAAFERTLQELRRHLEQFLTVAPAELHAAPDPA